MRSGGLLLALMVSLGACTPAVPPPVEDASLPVEVAGADLPFEQRNGPVCASPEEGDDPEEDANCEALPLAMQAPGPSALDLHEQPRLSSPVIAKLTPGEAVSKIDNAFLYYKAHRGVVRSAGSGLSVGQIVYPATPFESDAYPFHAWDDPDDEDYRVLREGQPFGSDNTVEFKRPDAAKIEWTQLRPKETQEHWILLKRADGSQGWALSCASPPEKTCAGSRGSIAETRTPDPGAPVMLYELRSGVVNSAAFSPDGGEVVTASRDGVIRMWNMRDGKEAASFSVPGGEARDASFSPDGARIVTTTADGAASVWTREGRLLFLLKEGNPGASTAAYSSDGTRILTTGPDNIARIWDAATGKPLLTLTSLASSIEFARFSPDGARVVTDSIDNYAVEVWDAASGRLLQKLENGGLGLGADFSPDGRLVASIGWDTMTVHEAASGAKRFAVMVSETNRVFSSVAFARDGKRIITGDEYGIAQVWNATDGELIFGLNAFDPSSAFYRPGPARPLSHVAISPDGSRILTVGRGAAHIWGAN